MAENTPKKQESLPRQKGVKEEMHTQLKDISNQVDASIQKKIAVILAKVPGMPEGAVKQSLDLIKQTLQFAHANSAAMSVIINQLHQAATDGGDVKPGAPILPQEPLAEGVSAMIEKGTALMQDLKKKIRAFGSDILKMIESAFGPNTWIGQLFAEAKNDPVAQKIYLERILKEKTVPDLDIETLNGVMRQQVAEGVTIEKKARKQPVTYDFVQHMKALLDRPELAGKQTVSQSDIIAAGKNLIADYEKELPAAAPQLASSAVAEQRIGANPTEIQGVMYAFTPNSDGKVTLEKNMKKYDAKITQGTQTTKISDVIVAKKTNPSDPTTLEFTVSIGATAAQKLSIQSSLIADELSKTTRQHMTLQNGFELEFTEKI